MISHPVSRSRSGIVDQGSVCRARGRTRRTSERHFPRDGNRPAVLRFRPCRLHAAALYLCLEGFHRRCCDPRAGFRQAAVGPPDQAPPGQNRAKYHPPRRHPPSVPRPGARSAENVRRLGSSWAHTASIHRLPVLSGRRSSSAGAPSLGSRHCWQRRSGAEEADCSRARIRDRCRQSQSARSGAPTRPKQSSGTKRRQRDLPCPRTESSNPFPSSGESANYRFRSRRATSIAFPNLSTHYESGLTTRWVHIRESRCSRTGSSNPSPSSRQSVSRGISPFCIEKPAVAAACAGSAGRHGRQRRAGLVNITPTAGNISVGPYSGTAAPAGRSRRVALVYQARSG